MEKKPKVEEDNLPPQKPDKCTGCHGEGCEDPDCPSHQKWIAASH